MKKNKRLEERRKLIDPKIKESIDIKCEQMITKITFTKEAIPFILEALGLKIDEFGLVRDANTNHIIENVEGYPFKYDTLIGIVKDKFITSEDQLEFLAEELHQEKLKKLL